MTDEMKARSAFTGIAVVAYGFEEANQYARKLSVLHELLRYKSGEQKIDLSKLIAARLEGEKNKSANDPMKDRCSLSPVVGDRSWFKRQSDGKLFRCEASTFGKVALCCTTSAEHDVIELNDGSGWRSVITNQFYVRVPTIRKFTTTHQQGK